MKPHLSFVLILFLILLHAGNLPADSIIFSGCDFICSSDDFPGYSYTADILKSSTGSTCTHFFAPVHLPHGAKVTSMVIFFYDNSVTGDIEIYLVRENPYTRVMQCMVGAVTNEYQDSDEHGKVYPVTYWKIDNSGYAYYLWVYFTEGSDNLEIHKIKINYIPPS